MENHSLESVFYSGLVNQTASPTASLIFVRVTITGDVLSIFVNDVTRRTLNEIRNVRASAGDNKAELSNATYRQLGISVQTIPRQFNS